MARAAARCGPSSRLLENGRILISFFADDFFFIGRGGCQKVGWKQAEARKDLMQVTFAGLASADGCRKGANQLLDLKWKYSIGRNGPTQTAIPMNKNSRARQISFAVGLVALGLFRMASPEALAQPLAVAHV